MFVRSASGTWHVLVDTRGEKAITGCDRIVKPSRISDEAEHVRWIKPASSVCTECVWPEAVRAYWNSGAQVRVADLVDARRDELIEEGVDPDVARRAAYYERGISRGFSAEDAMALALEADW